jgi:hypothetical protein
MNGSLASWSVESLVDLLQDRDQQMDFQEVYFEAAEELAFRVSNLLACIRFEDRKGANYKHGHSLYTDEIRETLADRVE